MKHIRKIITLLALTVMLPFAAFAEEITAKAFVSGNEVIGFLREANSWPIVGPFIPYIMAFVFIAAQVAPWLPQGNPNTTVGNIWNKVRLVLVDIPAGNYLNAKNKA